MFHCQYSNKKRHIRDGFSATAKQHATITLIETPEMGQQLRLHNYQDSLIYRISLKTAIPLTFFLSVLSTLSEQF